MLVVRAGCYSYAYWFFFQAEDGIRYLVRSRGLGDVYKRQGVQCSVGATGGTATNPGDDGVAAQANARGGGRLPLSLIHI